MDISITIIGEGVKPGKNGKNEHCFFLADHFIPSFSESKDITRSLLLKFNELDSSVSPCLSECTNVSSLIYQIRYRYSENHKGDFIGSKNPKWGQVAAGQ
ncbi:MAG: hypothetical protein KAW12_07340 [Candidatus Aminicenantes bacterium]|nr:hypothetical protein [Candidatus Aminicenantes bacterium]